MKLILLFSINFIIILFLINFTVQTNIDMPLKPLVVCNKYTCPKSRGVCNEENECICLNGYDTIDDLSKGDFYCNYKRKSKLFAFLLEFVLGFGSGHFYIGNINLATAKLAFTTLTCLLFCQYNSIKKITEIRRVAVPLERLFVIGWVIWQLIDGILIFFGIYKDGNGFELK